MKHMDEIDWEKLKAPVNCGIIMLYSESSKVEGRRNPFEEIIA